MYSLGIEFSTQSVKMVVLDLDSCAIHYTDMFGYDSTFPEYETQGGVLPSDSADVRHTSPCMLVKAIDFTFQKLNRDGIDLSNIRSIKTDGMQHCTIYTNKLFKKIIKRLDPEKTLVDQLEKCFSRKTSPIWEDRSPVEEVQYLTDSLEKFGGINTLTGNRAELRFPAAQILKWAKESPAEYEHTSHIFLLSAFITSILAGELAPVDTGDGWGTNLNHLDIKEPGWSHPVISAADTYLKNMGRSSLTDKIGDMVHYDTAIGKINPYFAGKFHMRPDTIILAGTGDNPATLMGCGGNTVISMGSSYTVNGVMDSIVASESGEYNIFGYAGKRAMALSVITNGGKVHDYFHKKFIRKGSSALRGTGDWKLYTEAVGSLRLSKKEKLMLPYLMDESVPLKKSGIICDEFSPDDEQTTIRSLHLSQALSLKLHSGHLGLPEKLCVVGGGAKSPVMRQWIADAFNIETYSINSFDMAAPMGCAISGAAKIINISSQEAFNIFVTKDEKSICQPKPEQIDNMNYLLARYRKLEDTYAG
ncbi:MAG: hypothetical protein JRJ76_09000 [Deltaproteobacteria bacterium]|nr:hypothetical protein [Deltaproteobacteria bacterium]